MSDINYTALQVGDWLVEPALNRLSRNGERVEIEPKTMEVLVYLAAHPGAVISSDALIGAIWDGRPMGDNPVHQCVSKLRQVLGDNAKNPTYIATIHRRGYRLIASVGGVTIPPVGRGSRVSTWTTAAAVATAITAAVLFALFGNEADTSPPPAPTISVQPFESLSGDPYFASGVAEDIRSALASIDGLQVSSGSASSQFGLGTDPQLIGDRLGVAWVLEGKTRTDAGNVRVTVQLIDTKSRFVRWSQTYKGVATEIFDIQRRVAMATSLAVASRMPVEGAPLAVLTDRQPDIKAYDEFLRGQAELNKPHDDASLTSAESHFKAALEHDPNFARAYAGLCRAYVARFIVSDATGWINRAEQACLAAQSLDSGLSEVPAAIGRLYRRRGQWHEALAAFESAIAVNVNSIDALTGRAQTLADMGNETEAESAFLQTIASHPYDWIPHTRFASFLFQRGRFAEAASLFQRVVELRGPHAATFGNLGASLFMTGDFEMAAKAYEESIAIKPSHSAHSNLGTLRYFLGDYSSAGQQYRAAIDLQPQDFTLWGNLGDALNRQNGSGDAATRAFRQALELGLRHLDVNPKDDETHAKIAYYLVHLGDASRASRHIERAIGIDKASPYVRYLAAGVFVLLEDDDRALSELEMAVQTGYNVNLVRVDPLFLSLRRYARFQRLLAHETTKAVAGS